MSDIINQPGFFPSTMGAQCHMPFLTTVGRERVMLFCRATGTREESTQTRDFFPVSGNNRIARYAPWKLHASTLDSGQDRPILTGFPPDSVECNPTLFLAEGRYRVSFVGGLWDQNRQMMRFHLYQMSGSSLTELSVPVRVTDRPTRVGFISPSHTAYSAEDGQGIVLSGAKETLRLDTEFDSISNLTFLSDCPQQLVITGRHGQSYASILFDTVTRSTREIVVEGRPVYKCSILGPTLVHARQVGSRFEDRSLIAEPAFELIPSKMTIAVSVISSHQYQEGNR